MNPSLRLQLRRDYSYIVGSWLTDLAQRKLKATNVQVVLNSKNRSDINLTSLSKKLAVQVTQEDTVAVPAVATTYQ